MEIPATRLPIADGGSELSPFTTAMHDVDSSLARETGHEEKPGLLLIPALSSSILTENLRTV